jgi:hypothetical protein
MFWGIHKWNGKLQFLSVALFSECITMPNQRQKFRQNGSRNNGFFTDIKGSFGGIFSTLPYIQFCGCMLVYEVTMCTSSYLFNFWFKSCYSREKKSLSSQFPIEFYLITCGCNNKIHVIVSTFFMFCLIF